MRSRSSITVALALALAGATAMSLPGTSLLGATAARAQVDLATSRPRDPNAQLLLQADELVYDNDRQVVTATGNVRLEYDGYDVVARRVSYNQRTRRVVASGDVELIEPDGNRIYAQTIDLTDDFSDGFVNALRVETPENTRFAAESAERRPGDLTVFNNGVYTACEVCRENPQKPPLWQIKAQRVILNGVEKTVEYRNASFELFGQPIAFLPYFRHPDPSVERKSGFLAPSIGYDENLGGWLRVPYFWVTGPNHDVTATATAFSRQGLLADVEWRHQLATGLYSIRLAGIVQQDRDAFTTTRGIPVRPDGTEDARGLVNTTGLFALNERWNFGWNWTEQSDRTFASTYDLGGLDSRILDNEIFLRGLGDRNYFDASIYRFLVQAPANAAGEGFEYQEDEQPIVLPVVDYERTQYIDGLGAEAHLDVNVTSLSRTDISVIDAPSGDSRVHGVDGHYTRATAEAGVQKVLTTDGGIRIVPSAWLRGDLIGVDANAFDADTGTGLPGDPIEDGGATRGMVTGGLEVSYPILATTPGASHVIEPVAQLFVRPDLAFSGTLPNEDAQSLVFDSSNLFRRDKFSGYDRIESGTRANIGLRYSALLDSGFTVDATVGQSYHLAGSNPFARTDDLTNTGEESGLETDRSDYVAGLAIGTPTRFSFDLETRFDESDLDLRRVDGNVNYAGEKFTIQSGFTFVDEQPNYAFGTDRAEVYTAATYRLNEEWTVSGGVQWDVKNQTLVSYTAGLSYVDECFTLALSFKETRNRYTVDETNQSLTVRVGLRTLADTSFTFNPENALTE